MRNAWIWIVVLAVIGVAGVIWWQNSQSPTPSVDLTPTTDQTTNTSTSDDATATSTETGQSADSGAPMSATVSYTSGGFSPAQVTIKKGGTVTWTQDGGSGMWVASAPHPAHTGYDGTSRSTHCAPGYTGAKPFDECAPGATYSFTFDKVGTWPYHDHMNASKYGTITVVE